MLTQRQKDILRLIIQNYTKNNQPVGSKKLMNDGIDASSATIRNEMKSLEEHGLLAKTHSSSGRIPSIAGYRYYVDYLLKPTTVDEKERLKIRQGFRREFHEINEIIQESADILSELTSYTAFSLGPDVKTRKLTGFRMVPLNNHQVVAVLVTDKGNVQSRIFSIPYSIQSSDLEKMVQIINDRLVGEELLTVYHRLRTEIPMTLHKYYQSTEGILDLFDGMLNQLFEEKVYVSGRMNLLNYEPTQDLQHFKLMYDLMSDTDGLNQIITPSDQSIQIRIGSEIGHDLFQNMSLIQATYQIDGHGQGTIALLGPSSMQYSKMFGLLDAFRQELSEKLGEYYRSLDQYR